MRFWVLRTRVCVCVCRNQQHEEEKEEEEQEKEVFHWEESADEPLSRFS